MIDFEFCSPTKFVFGRGSEAKVGELVKAFGGTKALFRPLSEADVREILKLACR